METILGYVIGISIYGVVLAVLIKTGNTPWSQEPSDEHRHV